MLVLSNVVKTFSAAFGLSRTGKTVTAAILDEDGNAKGSGYSLSSVVELGDGTYGVKITFTEKFSGYIQFENTTDSISVFVPFQVDDLHTPQIKKNTALSNFMFVMTDTTNHEPMTGLTVTAERSIDGAAFASCANSVSELSNGVYVLDLAATDLNGDVITLRMTGTGADDRLITLVTQS